MRSLFFLLVVTTLATLTKADTPANCTWPEIAGKWIFIESERLETRTENCDEQHIPLNGGVNKVYLKLDFPNLATDREGNLGTWTLIYNQGFEVIINYRKYFAFSLYKQKGSTVTSYCNATQPGWSHDVLGNNWACFRGRKVVSWDQEEEQMVKSNELFSSAHSSAGRLVGVGKEHRVRPFLLEKVDLHRNHLSEHAVRRINAQQSGWTAKVYEDLREKSTEELVRMAGGKKSRLASRPKPKEVDEETKRRAAALPEEFDWRNVDGVNYVSPVRDQGSCGSCYIFSSMALLEARLRIATNNSERTVFSTQEVVDCSRYSQGCDGGFPYLIGGKYAQDYGVIDDACYPYTATAQQCKSPSSHASTQCRKRTYAAKYNYVGGYYGGCNEELMRLELVTGGPIAVGFEVYPDFMSYSGGVYSHDAAAHRHTMARLGFNPFELTNHAVLIVGYGVDRQSGQKYWIVKNSWSENWGLKGYFLIRRGTDECGIESLAVAAKPIP